MADPTSNFPFGDVTSYKITLNRETKVIKNGEALVLGALGALEVTSHEVEFPAAAVENLVPAGWIETAADGNNENLTGDASGTRSITVIGDVILDGIDVVGAGSSVEYGAPVWATDGQTLTLTRQDSIPCGFVKKYKGTGTSCVVRLFSPDTIAMMNIFAGHSNREVICLGTFTAGALGATGAFEISTNFPINNRCTLVNAFVVKTADDAAASAGSRTITFEKNTTAIDGLSLAVAHDDTAGAIISDAPTSGHATADFNMGDTISAIVASGGTNFDTLDSSYALFITIDRKCGK